MSSVKADTSLISTRPTSGTRVEAGLASLNVRRLKKQKKRCRGYRDTHTPYICFMRGRERKFTALRVPKQCLSFAKGRRQDSR
jgi:hypothetical protein